MKRPLSGLMIFAIAVLVGIGSGLAVLAFANRYTDQQKDKAVHAALVRQYDSSLAACKRGNTLRRKLNHGAIKTLHDFLQTARTARLAAAKAATKKADRILNEDAAESYKTYLANLGSLSIIDCPGVYTHP